MPRAFVYGGGRPVATSFDPLRRPMPTAGPMAATAAPGAMAAPQPAAPDFSRYGAAGGMVQRSAPFAPGRQTPTPWDPNNPFANVPDVQSGMRAMLGQGGDVFQRDYLRKLMRKRALMSQRNQNRRGEVMGRLAGLDPMQMRQSMVDTNRQSGSDMANAMNEADLAGGQGYYDLLRSIMMSERGGESALFGQREQRNWEDSQRGGFGDFLGGVIGTGVGAFTGGAGSGLAGGLFKK